MAVFKKVISVTVFIFIFVCDLFYVVEPEWYGLLFCLTYLLFDVQPTKALAEILAIFKTNSNKTNSS